MKKILSFTLNGKPVEVAVKTHDTLLDILREELGATGAKRGCDAGDCGACTVIIDGLAIRACLTIALTVEGRDVVTIEGLGDQANLHPLQQSFYELGAHQCGFCTSGMIISAKTLLDKNPHPTHEELVEYMSGNLCRCGTYVEVAEAIKAVSGGKD